MSTATLINSFATNFQDSEVDTNSSTDKPILDKVSAFVGCIAMATATLVMGTTTELPTYTKEIEASHFAVAFDSIFRLVEQSSSRDLLPHGYEIQNEANVLSYLERHVHLKQFLEDSLETLKAITETTRIGIDYEGMKEEGWESLYIIAHLSGYDDEYASNLEDKIYDEWLDNIPDNIKQQITVSFDWT